MEQQGLVFLGVFALVGFIAKAAIVANISIKSRIAESFTVLCLFMIGANIAEFLGYFTYIATPEMGIFFVNLYMIALYFVFPSMIILALALIELPDTKIALIRKGLYFIAGLISVAHAAGYMTDGVTVANSGWTATLNHGQYYWVGIAWASGCALSNLVLLTYHYLNHPDFEIRSRCKVYLIAFSPVLLIALGVPTLKLVGFEASTAVSLPIAMVIFPFIMLLHTNGNIFWASLKFKILMAVIGLRKSDSLDEILGKIEEVRIREALKASNGRQNSAAELLGVPASTLCKKISKYGIQPEAFQRAAVLGGK